MNATKPLRLALVGNPNCGKTALFNRLTGARQKVANYAGVTVERKEGSFTSANGMPYQVIDLPGTYSLNALTPDEIITRDVLLGYQTDEAVPDIVVLVVDVNNLQLNLRLVLEVLHLQRPAVLALNKMDVAKKRGLHIDTVRLQEELGIPVVETVAIQTHGTRQLEQQLDSMVQSGLLLPQQADSKEATPTEVRRILKAVITRQGNQHSFGDKIDAVVLHPVWGYLILALVLFFMFQAVFSWSTWPMEQIKKGIDILANASTNVLPQGILRSLLVDGVLAGAGSVLVFLPQILILFFFILTLEESGYLPRAAFLLDRLMGSVGLSGRAFIPLLSSFACAIPGIMATRTIPNPRDRIATIMIAPLMTCSARLPVYALIIGAFIPHKAVGMFNLQGLVLFGLYLAGIVSAMAVAYVMKRTYTARQYHPLMLELPAYHWPNVRNLLVGLWERARIFMVRVGTIIMALMVLLWFLSTFPSAPEGATQPAIHYSMAGRLGHLLEGLFLPIGFNWQIVIALIPGLAAREVAVGALGTVYALSAAGEDVAGSLAPLLAASWSLPTAFSLLAWYVFAPQCVATLSVVRRETNSWKTVMVMLVYMFTLAYVASLLTYQISKFWLGEL